MLENWKYLYSWQLPQEVWCPTERRATLVSAEYNQESYWQQMTWPALIKQTKFFRPNIICSNYKGRSICVLASSDVDSAMDIADPSSIQAACHIWSSWWASLAVESLWLSDRASESGIQRSEVRFLMGTQNLFFVLCWWEDKRHISLFLYQAQNLPSLLIYLSSQDVAYLKLVLAQKPHIL